jgi:hypothetical protein
MKYKNTTTNAIFVKIDEGTQLIQPGQEVISKSSLEAFGLTALQTSKPKPKVAPEPPTKQKQATPKPKPVSTNEFPTANPAKD